MHIEEPIAGFELKLERGDGKQVRVKGGGKPGVTRALPLEQPEGDRHARPPHAAVGALRRSGGGGDGQRRRACERDRRGRRPDQPQRSTSGVKCSMPVAPTR